MDDIIKEYRFAKRKFDYERMAELIRQGTPVSVLLERPSHAFDTAIDLAIRLNNYILVDALLSRSDIQDVVAKELFAEGIISLRILRYLEEHGVDLDKVIFEYKGNILIDLILDYTGIIFTYGEERCKELCELIDFFKSRGVDTVKAYQGLVNDHESEDPIIHLGEDCYNEVAKRLKPKGGRKWKLRG